MRKNFGRLPARGRVKRKTFSLKTIGKKSYNTAKKAISVAKMLGKVYAVGKMIQGAM